MMIKKVFMVISVCIVAYNEENNLSDILSDILAQTYLKKNTELVLVDNASADATYEVLRRFRDEHIGEYLDIKVEKNTDSNLPSGLNVGLRVYTGEVFVRVDAHASLAPDFLERVSVCLEGSEEYGREDVCGGQRPVYCIRDDGIGTLLISAESSKFGAGAASYRGELSRSYVDSIFHAAYRREVIDRVGEFNCELRRTEDNEYNYRVRRAGYRICFDPSIRSSQQVRPTFKKMLKQKYQNGYWIGYTLGVCPGCVGTFHLVPFAFVSAAVVTTLMAAFGLWWFSALMWSAYALCNILFSVKAVLDTKRPHAALLLLPFVFLLIHVFYGVGTARGLLRLACGRKKRT